MAMSYFDHELFSLSAVIVNINVKLCARIESGVKQLLSLVTRYVQEPFLSLF